MTREEAAALRSFWRFFFAGLPSGLRLEVRHCQGSDFEMPIRTFFDADDPDSMTRFVVRAAAARPHQIHYSPAPEFSDGCDPSGIRAMSGFWADFDAGAGTDGEIDGVPFYMDVSSAMSLGACAVIGSGSGRHVYWKIPNMDGQKFAVLLALFSEASGADPNVSPSHLLRAPCTLNCKYFPPRTASFLHFAPKTSRYETLVEYATSRLGAERTAQLTNAAMRSDKGHDGRPCGATRADDTAFVSSAGGVDGEVLFSEDGPWRSCLLVRKARTGPELLSYREWVTLAALCRLSCGDDAGFEAFRRFSELDGGRYDYEETERVYMTSGDSGFCGWSCENLGLRTSGCGRCRGVIVLARMGANAFAQDSRKKTFEPKEKERDDDLWFRKNSEMEDVR